MANKFTRGIANNNPSNIRKGCHWQGLSSVQNDREFCTFVDMLHGVRALLVLLRTYRYKYDCVTLREVINRFAPPSENNTWAYLVYVRDYLRSYFDSKGIPLDVDFDMFINLWTNRKVPCFCVYPLAKAICMIESRYDLDEKIFNHACELL